jgi:tetratricopeptide (TPR) repeat protein
MTMMQRLSRPLAGLFVLMATSTAFAFQFSRVELGVWNDPAFKKAFAESYMAETDIEPRITERERKQMMEVLELISANQKDTAEDKLRRMRNDASSAVFDFIQANIYFTSDRLDEAADTYRIAVEKFPKFRRAHKNLGIVCMRQLKYREAAASLSRVIELGGGDGLTYGLLGFAYANIEDHIAAESAYRMATLLDPRTIDWKMQLARTFFKQTRYADASSLLATLLEQTPDRTDLWLLQANAFIGLNQPMRAAENFEIVDRLGGSTVETLQMLGDIYINETLFERAVDTYIRAMALDPQSKVDRPLRAAALLVAQSEYDETLRLLDAIDAQRAGRLDDKARKDMLKLRSRIAVARGAGEEEFGVLREIVRIDPMDGEALILLGQYYGRAGDMEQAIFQFERAASIDDFTAEAKKEHGRLLVKQGKYAEALPLLRAALSLKPRESLKTYVHQVEQVARSKG